MQREHRDAIQKNFSSLVEQTDLDLMVSALYEKGVFSDLMIEPFRDTSMDLRMRKRRLYRDITRRGPDAFRHLLDALSENGYWDLVRDLDPNSSLHTRTHRPVPSSSTESSYVSIANRKSGKEQYDPNQNRAGHVEKKHNATESGNGNNERVSPPKASGNAHQNDEIPHFNVIKSEKFVEDNESDIKLYRTRGRNRGVLVLFTYVAFRSDIEPYRHGAARDAANLQYLFSELGFKVLKYCDLDREETHKALSELRHSICAEGRECVFVVFSSHGHARANSGDTDLRCADGLLLSLYTVVAYFNNENFPELNGVPKVFIFQTCRGDNYLSRTPIHMTPPVPRHSPPAASTPQRDVTTNTATNNARVQADGATFYDAAPADINTARDRLYSDILIAHSTVPGYVSNRDQDGGSWYIQALCDVFAARAHDCHVEKLFTLVDERLRTRFRTQTSSVDRWGFNKRLFLHPGLYED